MQMITSAVRTMGRQLDNLLELSRVGRVVHPFEAFSLSRLCAGVVQRMAGVVDQYGGEVEIDEDMPSVFADPVSNPVTTNAYSNCSTGSTRRFRVPASVSRWSSAILKSTMVASGSSPRKMARVRLFALHCHQLKLRLRRNASR